MNMFDNLSFQGQEVGTSSDPTIKYAAKLIVCDPGPSKFEGNNPGTTYSGLGSVKTIGKAGRDKTCPKNSIDSIFFYKAGTFPKNIKDLTRNQNGNIYKKVALRKYWTQHLLNKKSKLTYTDKEEKDLIDWVTNFDYKKINLHDLIRSKPNSKHKKTIEPKMLPKKNWSKKINNLINSRIKLIEEKFDNVMVMNPIYSNTILQSETINDKDFKQTIKQFTLKQTKKKYTIALPLCFVKNKIKSWIMIITHFSNKNKKLS